MGINPGNLAYGMPPAADDQVRKQRDLERQARENASARGLAASQIGSGGLLVTDGGSITIEGTGSLNVGAGALNSAGAISAGTTIAAGTDITAGGKVTATGEVKGGTVTSTGDVAAAGAVSGASLSVTGTASIGDVLTADTGMSSLDARNRVLVSSYGSVYADSTGRFGQSPSSRRFKQDITPTTIDPEAVYAAELVTFRYIAAVEELGESAPVETGAIAEQFADCGLGAFLVRDSEGVISGIAYEKLTVALIATVQSLNERLTALGG
jgi:hypothetical protein